MTAGMIAECRVLIMFLNQVAGEAQGESSSLDKFVQHLRMGPSAAQVSRVDHNQMDVKDGETGFERQVYVAGLTQLELFR